MGGLAVIDVASPLLWPRPRTDEWANIESTLSLRIALASEIQSSVDQFLATVTQRSTMISASTARQCSCLDLVYRVRLRLRSDHSPLALVAEFNRLEGIENVELKRE